MTDREPSEFEFILEIRSTSDQVFLKSMLDAEGIVYFIQGEHVAPYLYHAVPMRLMVRKDHAATARELLKNFELAPAYGGLKTITP